MSEQQLMVTFDQLLTFIIECNNPQNTTIREKLISQYYSNDRFLLMLESLIKTLNNLQEKQHCANMIDIIFCKRMECDPKPLHFRRIFTYFTTNLLDFEFPADVKKLFFKSFSQSFSCWHQEIQDFWQEVVEALIDLLELAGNGNNKTQQQYFCKKINTICLSQPFPVILPRSFKVDEVYLTIIFFFTVFFEEFRVRDSTYQQRGMKMLKKLQSQIFNTDFIISKSRIIYRFLDFEEKLFYQISQQKQLKTAAFFVCNWSELLVHLQVVLLTKAMHFQKKQNCYNFFLLSEDWSQTRFLQLKRSALDIMNYIITISEQLGDASQESECIGTLDFLSDSVYYSLLWMIKQNRSPRDSETDLELALLRNFYLFINIFHPNLEQRKSIMKELIFPIILHEINQTKTLFQSYQEETEYLTECLYSNSLESRLGLASKLLQQILGEERDFGTYIRTYMFAILAAKLNIGVNFQASIEEEAKKWPMQVCFFVLTVLDIQTRSEYLEEKAFGALLTQSAFMALSIRQKKYLYFYLAHTWEHYFGPNDSDVLFINYIFSPQCKIEEEYFALDLIFEISDHYCNDDFISKFLRYFPNFRNQQLALQVASKLFGKYLHRINEYIVSIFVNYCSEKAKKMTDQLLLQLQRNQHYPSNTYKITSYLNVCQGIAKDISYVKGKPDLIQCLVEAFRLTPKMAKISAEENAIHIGTEVLRALKRFPDKFISMIPKIISYFKASEYNGIAFYDFFGECMETMSTYPYDEQMSKLVCELQQAFAEAYAYYIYYPELIADDQKQHLGEAQVLLLNIFIYFGDKIKPKMIAEAKNLSSQLLKVQDYSNENMLVLRTNIMLLLCEILTTKNYPISHIYTAVKGKLFLSNADSKLLIFLLNQIRPALQPPDQFVLAVIVLELLNSSQCFKLSRDLPFKESFKKYTSIFSYITLPVDACLSEVEQASQFFKTYKAEDSGTCQLVIRQIQFGDDYPHLRPFLQRVLILKQKDFINLGLFDPNQPIFPSEEEEKTKSPPLTEAPSSKRKIMKIIGEKDANGNTQIFYAHSNLKRNSVSAAQSQNEDSEDDVMLDLNGKRRKINEQASVEKISKRVLMREKQSKKVVRI